MNGLQVAEAGRRLRPGLKVLFLTGHAHAGIQDALEPGTRLVTKPVALVAAVDALLSA